MNMSSATLLTDDLPPPSIKENPGFTVLNPVAVRDNLTILVDDVQPDDEISVTLAGAPGTGAEGSYTSSFSPAGTARPVERRIDNSLVTFNLSKTITLTYSVKRGTSAPVTSQPLILYVLPMAQGDLPRPFIPQATDDGEGLMLYVNELTEFTLRTHAWSLHRQGQYLWQRLRGTKADGSVFDVPYWSAPNNVIDDEFNRFGFYERNYSAVPLQGLKDRSVLTLELMVALQKSQDESLAQKFAHRNYIVRTNAATTPRILSVKDPDNQEIPDNDETAHTSLTLSGTARAGDEVEIFDERTSQGTASADSGTWELLVAGLTGGPHVFTAKTLNGNGEASNSWAINIVLRDLSLSIKEAPDNANLDPLAATRSLTAVVNYDMLPDDRVSVRWTGAQGTLPAGSHVTNTVLAGSTRPREIPLPVSVVAFSLGKPVTVTFTYERGLSPPVTSLPFFLNVGTIPAAEFVAPVITQANGTTVLDLKTVTAGATLLCSGWPHIASGQRIAMVLEGTDAKGEPHNLTVWRLDRNAVTRSWASGGTYSQNVSYDYLKDLGPDTKLSIHFSSNMDQVANSETAVVFQPRVYTILADA